MLKLKDHKTNMLIKCINLPLYKTSARALQIKCWKLSTENSHVYISQSYVVTLRVFIDCGYINGQTD